MKKITHSFVYICLFGLVLLTSCRKNQPPDIPAAPGGPSIGFANVLYSFTTTTSDPEGDDIAFQFEWGDGTRSNWSNFIQNDSSIIMVKSWITAGTYSVRVRAKDAKEKISEWSGERQIIIYANDPPNVPLTPNGDSTGNVGDILHFSTTTTDPNNDSISYQFVWGNSDTSNWSNFFPSGATRNFTHTWTIVGTYYVKVRAKDIKGASSDWSLGHRVTIILTGNVPPNIPATPLGPTSTYANTPEVFSASTIDPNGDSVSYQFDWGDVTISNWTDFVSSGTTIFLTHGWLSPGTYSVRVRAKDTYSSTSNWSNGLSVTVLYNSPPTIDSITGPGVRPYLMSPSSTRYIQFTTVAYDSTDSVYVRFMSKRKSAASYTLRSWIGPKVSGSTFRDSLTFTQQDTYYVRAIAKDSRNSQSETTDVYTVIVVGPIWTFNTPDEYEFYSSPALAQVDGEWLIFIGGVDGYFYIVSASNGNEKWTKKSIYNPAVVPNHPVDVFYASPAINTYFTPPHIYIGGEAGELYCYKAASGSLWEWRFPDSSYDALTYNEISNSVTFKDNRVYVGINCGYANDYRLYALQDNGSTCSVAWSFPTGCDIVSSPAIDASGNIYFGDDSGYVTRLTSSGTGTWRIRIGTGMYSIYSSIAIASDGLYVGTDNGFLYKLNAATGATIWKYPSSGSGLNGVRSSPVIGIDGAIYFGCDDGKLYAVTASGQLKSGFPVTLSDDVITSTPAIAQDGSIIMYTDEDLVYSVNPNGTIMWRVPLPGYSLYKGHRTYRFAKNNMRLEDILPSPTIGNDGTIYVGSVQQGVHAIRGSTNNSLANTAWPKFRHDLLNSGKYAP